MPDFDNGQGRSLAWLAIAFLIVLLTAVPLSELLIAAWDAEGVVYTTVHDITRAYSLDIDLFVVIPTGMLLGWLGLFAYDQTKRIQAVILLVAIIPFATVLQSQGVWTDYVSWGQLLQFVALGLLFGLITGSIDKILYGLQYREFPIAAQALFFTTAITLVTAFVDLLVSTSTPLLRIILFGGAVIVFVGLFGSFVQYTNRRDIVIFTPGGHRGAEATLVTGLYDLAKARYETRVSEGAGELNNARANLAENAEPNPFTNTIEFRFKPAGWFSRWVTVNADGYDLQNLYEDEFEQALKRTKPPQSIRGKLGSAIKQVIPTIWGGDSLGRRIQNADLLVMVVPLSDSRIQSPLENGTLADSTAPDYLEMYNEICRATGERTDVLVATLDSEIVVEKFKEERGTEVDLSANNTTEYQQFEYEIREWLGQLLADSESGSQPFTCSIIPLSRKSVADDDNWSVANVAKLLKQLR